MIQGLMLSSCPPLKSPPVHYDINRHQPVRHKNGSRLVCLMSRYRSYGFESSTMTAMPYDMNVSLFPPETVNALHSGPL